MQRKIEFKLRAAADVNARIRLPRCLEVKSRFYVYACEHSRQEPVRVRGVDNRLSAFHPNCTERSIVPVFEPESQFTLTPAPKVNESVCKRLPAVCPSRISGCDESGPDATSVV